MLGLNTEGESQEALSTFSKVLLVEDYEPNVVVASMFLEEFGYTFDVVDNGEDALERIKNSTYHAILMDVQMNGLNGFQTTEKVREWEKNNSAAPNYIIGMTAHALVGDKQKCIDSGMNEYISKPFNPTDLENKLSNAKAA